MLLEIVILTLKAFFRVSRHVFTLPTHTLDLVTLQRTLSSTLSTQLSSNNCNYSSFQRFHSDGYWSDCIERHQCAKNGNYVSVDSVLS